VETVLQNVCPNCGGGFVLRPIRPQKDWRPETGLMFDKPGTKRRRAKYSREEITAFAAGISGIPPVER
jgi:uncharacterized protein